MTTARTHRRNVSRGSGTTQMTGAARAKVSEPKPDDFTPVSAETFGAVAATDTSIEADPSTLDYDPADHTADEVKEYVSENPETVDAILELELNGKGRSGLLSFLEGLTED